MLVLNRGAAATMELHGLASAASSGMAGALGMGKPPTLAAWRFIRGAARPLIPNPPKRWGRGGGARNERSGNTMIRARF